MEWINVPFMFFRLVSDKEAALLIINDIKSNYSYLAKE
tara:strand:- start:348 stop:461 length:114 start_codon:yes stop_codon:yes gene_type:complete